ncbi:MAG: ATP-binding cassette domain-containing protein [Candidatus Dependentiae bacterium]
MIQIRNLVKKFGDRTITDNLNLSIPSGQMTVIIGRSGEGKSLLLKQIIGLIKPTSGQILIDDTDITKLNPSQLNEQLKKFGYVFQFAALLDSLTVWQNVGISMLNDGHQKEEIIPIIKEKLALVQLPEDTLYKYPSELSGGMAKRVGLARTLITNPKIILYDEPTTGLDPVTERRIHELMFGLQKQFQVTSIVITHSTDLFQFADNIAFLYQGNIAYFGPAKDIWQCTNPYIYQFIRGLPNGPIKTY